MGKTVRVSEDQERTGDNVKKRYRVLSGDGFEEVIRTDRSTAESDVAIFRWLGKKAWVEEIER